jgi:hypothetical protein
MKKSKTVCNKPKEKALTNSAKDSLVLNRGNSGENTKLKKKKMIFRKGVVMQP